MAKKRTFISFDYDNDSDIKMLLAGQAKNPDTPFDIVDFSIKEHISVDWKARARTRIKGCDVFIVLCGEYTDTAKGVAAEHEIAKDENIPYFLLAGRTNVTCKRPTSAGSKDKMYNWTWDNLKKLIAGDR